MDTNKKGKKLKMFFSILLILIILACAGYYIFNQIKQKDTAIKGEYTPQEEISDTQLRQTTIKLYFQEKGTNNLKAETRNIDAKLLVENPCLSLIELLISGPTFENLEPVIPTDTKINSVKIEGEIAIIDFNSIFISNQTNDTSRQTNAIYSIANTLTELTEICEIRILIDGNEVDCFNNDGISLKGTFERNLTP